MPFALPDPADLRALAARIDEHAAAARARADRLGTAVAGCGWRGAAAGAFDSQAAVALGALRGAARRLEDAAAALRRHADAVEGVLELLTGLVRAGLATLPDLLALPADAVRGLVHGTARELDALRSAAGDGVSAARGAVRSALGTVGL